MLIKDLEPGDLDIIPELQPEGWPDIQPYIAFYLEDPFCFPFKVVVDNKIAGIGTAIVHNEAGWVAHIIVRPDYRNMGIGRLITETLVEKLRQEGCKTISLVATDLGAPVYAKVGFEQETNYLFFKNVKFEKRIIISEKVILYDEKYKEQLAALDRETSGEERFFHLESHLEGGFLFVKEGIAQGFYLPTLGEGHIIASTAKAGIELMKLRFTKFDFAVLPVNNTDAIRFLYENNFREFKTARRMRLGAKRGWKPENIYNRIGGKSRLVIGVIAMDIRIDKLEKKDIQRFMELIRLFENVFEMKNFTMPKKEHLEKLLEQDTFWVFVAILNEEVVGGLTTYTLPQCYSEKALVYIYDLAVTTHLQRKGIGRSLISAVIGYCRERNIEEVFVQADEEDDYALDFYRSTGAMEEKVRHYNYRL